MVALSLFGLALGEELWQPFLPAYLSALGASGLAVGLFASARDLLDGVYQYPGGVLSDRFGRRRMLLACTALALCGYAIYAAAPSWPLLFAGLAGAMCWKAGAFPTTFAVIGDALPPEWRARAFSLQSILTRVPRIIGAPLGGLVVATFGILLGLRLAFAVTVLLGASVLVLQHALLRADSPPGPRAEPRADAAPRGMPPALTALLLADSVVRIGEGIAASFILLFLTQSGTVSLAGYGWLYAFQQAVAIVSYLPGGRIADAAGRRPVVGVTFLCFALFPLAVRVASTRAALLLAFTIGGLKEIGEPARKALIVDLAPASRRAATVGLYYTWRHLLVVPAGLIGGWLWQRGPHLPLEVGTAVSVIGAAVFLLFTQHSEHSTHAAAASDDAAGASQRHPPKWCPGPRSKQRARRSVQASPPGAISRS